MRAITSAILTAVATVGACTTAPPKPVVPPPQEKAVEVAPIVKASPQLPATYTQKGVTVRIDGLWQAEDGGILGVRGTAKNATATDLRFCQILLGFLDNAGIKLDEAKASTRSLKSAEVWHFQAALAHPSQASYASIVPEKLVAIPVKPQGELANLR